MGYQRVLAGFIPFIFLLSVFAGPAFCLEALPVSPWNQTDQCPETTALQQLVTENIVVHSASGQQTSEQWTVHLEIPATLNSPSQCLAFKMSGETPGNWTASDACFSDAPDEGKYILTLLMDTPQGQKEESFCYSEEDFSELLTLERKMKPAVRHWLWSYLSGFMIAGHIWKSLVKIQELIIRKTACGHPMSRQQARKEAIFFLIYATGALAHLPEFVSSLGTWAISKGLHPFMHGAMLPFSALARWKDCRCGSNVFNLHNIMIIVNLAYLINAAI